MKTTRRNRKNTRVFPTHVKDRWLPTENIRVQTFADRRAVADKRACRGRVVID